MALPDTSRVVTELPRPLRPVLAPLKTVPFGLAIGVVAAGLFCAHALLAAYWAGQDPETQLTTGVYLFRDQLGFVGYHHSIPGAFAGLLWGLFYGFVGGWLMAFLRNKLVALWVFWVGARERLRANRNVLDDLM